MALNYLEGFTPTDLGFDPVRYPSYRTDVSGREIQLEVIEHGAYSSARFPIAGAPTGIGKELAAVSVAKVLGVRTVILTATKGLQDQYLRNHAQYGLVDLRGKSNFDCAHHKELDCRSGARMGCPFVRPGGSCEYLREKERARNAEIICTSYAMWMTLNEKANGLNRTEQEVEDMGENPVELLILDECHDAPRLLSDHMAVRIYEKEIERWVDVKTFGEGNKEWKQLAVVALPELKEEIATTELEILHLKSIGKEIKKEHVDVLHRLEKTHDKIERVGAVEPGEWVVEKREGTQYGRIWACDPVWPGKYAEDYLFCQTPRVFLMSATVRSKTRELLGIGKDQFEFKEWPRVFASNRHPIYNCPPRLNGKEVRMRYTMPDEELDAWVEWIDRIIDGRLDRKGIIQTVSYDRQRYLQNQSRHSSLFIGNTSDPESSTAAEASQEFKEAEPPALLVGPSFSTGWDFPYDECEYVIICKVPFKPANSKVHKARESRDPQYGPYMTMLEMVQGAGRGMRAPDDRCEVFITDGQLGWFMNQNKTLAPAWFAGTDTTQGAVRKAIEIPKAPEKLKPRQVKK